PAWGLLGASARGGASASAMRLVRGRSRSPLPWIVGSSKAIICSSNLGSRQKASSAWSKISCCSCRSSITAESAAWTSSRCEKPTASIASRAAITRSGPTGTPARRRTRAKWVTFSANTGAARLAQFVEQARHLGARHLGDVVAVLEEHAERVLHALRVEADGVEGDQRVGPVDRLGDARRLEQVDGAHPLDETDDLDVEPLRRARRPQAHDLELARRVGVADPVVEAAALQGVVDLPGAIAGDDDDR